MFVTIDILIFWVFKPRSLVRRTTTFHKCAKQLNSEAGEKLFPGNVDNH